MNGACCSLMSSLGYMGVYSREKYPRKSFAVIDGLNS
jgi:hypothetical protein